MQFISEDSLCTMSSDRGFHKVAESGNIDIRGFTA